MIAASTAAPKGPSRRARAPHANLFDLPELMPGAQPSANSAQREQFEERCRQLRDDEVAGWHEEVAQVCASSWGATAEYEAMFPALDPALVRALYSEAPTPQKAFETLLALSTAVS